MGQGLIVIVAAEEAASGASLDEIAAATISRSSRVHVYGVLGGLDFLQRGGRIGGAQALLGSLLSIKPVIQVKDGEVAEESKQRTRSRALSYMTAKVSADLPLERLAVADGACDDIVEVRAQMSKIEVAHPWSPCPSDRWSARTRGPTPSACVTSWRPSPPALAGNLGSWQNPTSPTTCRPRRSTPSTPSSPRSTTRRSAQRSSRSARRRLRHHHRGPLHRHLGPHLRRRVPPHRGLQPRTPRLGCVFRTWPHLLHHWSDLVRAARDGRHRQ